METKEGKKKTAVETRYQIPDVVNYLKFTQIQNMHVAL